MFEILDSTHLVYVATQGANGNEYNPRRCAQAVISTALPANALDETLGVKLYFWALDFLVSTITVTASVIHHTNAVNIKVVFLPCNHLTMKSFVNLMFPFPSIDRSHTGRFSRSHIHRYTDNSSSGMFDGGFLYRNSIKKSSWS